MMSWSFADGHGGRVESEKGFGRGADELRVGVYRPTRNVFDDVGLQQNRFAAHVQIEEAESLVDEFVEFVRVLISMQDCDTRPLRTEVPRIRACCNRMVRAEPVAAAVAMSQSRLFISNHPFERVRTAFSAGIPAALRTRPVAQHLHAQFNSIHDRFGRATGKQLSERDK